MSFNPCAWRYYAERLGFCFFSRRLLFFDLWISDRPKYQTDGPVEYRILSLEFSNNNGVIGWLGQRETVALHLREGFVLCGAFLNSKLVGNCWIELVTCDLEFLDLHEKLPNNVVYISRVFVSPEARGKRISEGLINFALQEAESAGKSVARICCVPSNQAMTYILPRCGFTYLGEVRYVRAMLLRLYRFWSADGRRIESTMKRHRASARIFGNWS
jgi:GNAT superfamily N-acetyltransferase